MKAVVLAAGKGSRLYPVTHFLPKPLLPLVNRPTLHYAFDRLREIGIEDVCLVVGENEAAMRNALGEGEDVGLRLTYVRQEEPKGLAHAMACASDFVGEESFVMYLGDAIYSEPLTTAYERFCRGDAANVKLLQRLADPSRFGIANTDGERITKLVEKPAVPESDLAMAGVYFFDHSIWEVLPKLQPSGRGEFEITDAIQLLVDRGNLVVASIYEGEWFDTGTLDSFLSCSAYLLGGGVAVAGKAVVTGQLGPCSCVGEGAAVECTSIADSVVLPGAKVRARSIRHCLIGGEVHVEGDLVGEIRYGEAKNG